MSLDTTVQTEPLTTAETLTQQPDARPNVDGAAGRASEGRTGAGARLPRITDEDIEACRTSEGLIRALAIMGRINTDGDAVTCPTCLKTDGLKKFKIHADGGYKHFSSGPGCWGPKGYGITLLMEGLGLGFPDAVRALVGKPTSVPVAVPDHLPAVTVNAFKAVTDPEVFAGILTYGRKAFGGEGAAAARDFYAQWHIAADIVTEFGAVYITQPDHLAEQILTRYGAERLIACGLFYLDKQDQPRSLIGKKWPVIEPGRNSRGDVTNLQFRASNEQYARYLRHKAKELPYEGNQKFINLRGVPTEAYLGCGLDRIAKLTEPTDVFWVEGFKDTMAAATMGTWSYGIPGVGYRPPKEVIDVMAKHRNVLALDGDDAGMRGVMGTPVTDKDGNIVGHTPGLAQRLHDDGLTVMVHELANGMDITDNLVLRHAASGCGCTACQDMRARLNV